MLAKGFAHLRAHTIAYVALVVALGGGASAVAAATPFVQGSGAIKSGIVEVAATPISHYVPGTTVGPNIVSIPNFGEIYVYACVTAEDGTLAGATLGFRNGSNSTWEGSQTGHVAPGQSAQLGDSLLGTTGAGPASRVASIVSDNEFDQISARCRFKVQVTVTS
jgi:hypothetical protein